jgi:hypothetical protein
MNTKWQHTFRGRMHDFEFLHKHPEDGIPVSIKVRVTSGCYHRSCSPVAYEIIDKYLEKVSPLEEFAFEEHESGPEILVFVTAGITLAASVINLIVTILKARSESIKKGDHRDSPLELIVRRSYKDGEFKEEKVLRVNHTDTIKKKEIEKALKQSLKVLLDKDSGENS